MERKPGITKSVQVLIVEDEMITAASIEQVLTESGYAVCGILDEAESALEQIKKLRPDFVIVDIQLNGLNDGIWLADRMNADLNIPFAYITAQGDKETIQAASKTRPFAYLIKPFRDEDVLETIELGLRNFSKNQRKEILEDDDRKTDDSLLIKDALFVKNGTKFSKVRLQDVLFFQSDKNYVDIFTEKKKFVTRNSLKEIANHISETQFIQINRSTIINIDKLDTVDTYAVHVNEHELVLSENFKERLIERLKLLGR